MGGVRESIDGRDFLQSSVSLAALHTMPSLGACRTAFEAMPGDLTALGASDLSVAIRQGGVSCVEVMQAYLYRNEICHPMYNAIVSMVDHADLLRDAALAYEAVTDHLSRVPELVETHR